MLYLIYFIGYVALNVAMLFLVASLPDEVPEGNSELVVVAWMTLNFFYVIGVCVGLTLKYFFG